MAGNEIQEKVRRRRCVENGWLERAGPSKFLLFIEHRNAGSLQATT